MIDDRLVTLNYICLTPPMACGVVFKTVWHSDGRWRHRSSLTLTQVVICYLNQWWHIIRTVLYPSPDCLWTSPVKSVQRLHLHNHYLTPVELIYWWHIHGDGYAIWFTFDIGWGLRISDAGESYKSNTKLTKWYMLFAWNARRHQEYSFEDRNLKYYWKQFR